MMTYEQARKHARAMMQTADNKAFLEFIVTNLCGVGDKIGGLTEADMYQRIGAHNVGVEIEQMTKEQG